MIGTDLGAPMILIPSHRIRCTFPETLVVDTHPCLVFGFHGFFLIQGHGKPLPSTYPYEVPESVRSDSLTWK